MSTRATTWGLLALLPLAACSTNATNPTASTMPAPGAAVRGVGAPDQSFASQAASSDLFEMQAAQLAVGKARRPAVRAYAQGLLDAHAAQGERLASLAGQKGITLPTAPNPAQARTLADLQGDSRSFDSAYVAAQTTAHRAAIANAQAEVNNGSDPDLKTYAQASLPTLQDHLDKAQRLRGGR